MVESTISELAFLFATWTDESECNIEQIEPNTDYNCAKSEKIENICDMMHPDSIKKWTMDQVMKWILNLYHSNSYRLEDVNLPVLKDITGKDLLNFNELNCQEIDHKKSKWLYEQVQELVRRCGSLELENHTDVFPSPPSSDDEIAKPIRFTMDICDLKNADSIKKWTMDQVMLWILRLYDSNSYRFEDLNLPVLKDITGEDLLKFNELNCREVDRTKGKWLYEQVQDLVKKCNSLEHKIQHNNRINFNQPSLLAEQIRLTVNNTTRPGRGRPRKNLLAPRPVKIGRIWEFLRDLLKDPRYCPQIIRWENINNLEFKLEDNKAVANIWGERKNKVDMKYENFSRSIRHYYKLKHSKIKSVPHKKLVYKFTPEALTHKDFEEFSRCTNNLQIVPI